MLKFLQNIVVCLMAIQIAVIHGLPHVISLDGIWTVQNTNEITGFAVNGSVPGGVYSALMGAGVLNDVLYRENDVTSRWVSKENWNYSTTFAVPQDFLNRLVGVLVLHGVDTFADVVVNDILVGRTDNMFVRYRFDVKHLLKEGVNNITLSFKSAVRKVYELQREHPTAPFCVPPQYDGECGANMARKMQASFSWDWGPAFPSMGPWKSVVLEAYDHPIIRDINVITTRLDNEWVVNVTVYLEMGLLQRSVQGDLMCTMGDYEKTVQFSSLSGEEGDFNATTSFKVNAKDVSVWWPNGLGSQTLYPLVASVKIEGKVEASRLVNVGFRTVELIQEPAEPDGLSFRFRVNDVDVFMKGSNWIPAHILPEWGANETTFSFNIHTNVGKIPVKRDQFSWLDDFAVNFGCLGNINLPFDNDTDVYLEWLLTSARDAHMNMLRVWGGGVYESDLFHDMCDRLGILIWQDYMFACAMYPTYPEFKESVRREVEQNTRRLQSHPSIALWAGNNENEAALRDDWYGTQEQFDRYAEEYVALYVDVVRAAVQSVDQSRSFVVSSPSDGKKSEDEGFIAADPSDPHYGDLHVYNYIADGWDPNIYPKGRFVSEYGFQALPSMWAWKEAGAGRAHRQHSPQGYGPIIGVIERHLTLPDEKSDEYEEMLFYYSQISQAMSIRAESEAYRVGRGSEANTHGALFWQLNDVWIAPTWSSIEFGGNWKMLQYHALEFFAPTMVALHVSPARDLKQHVVRDELQHVDGILQLSVLKWDSFDPLTTENTSVTVPGNSVLTVRSQPLDKYLQDAGCSDPTSCFIKGVLLSSAGEPISPPAYVFPTALKGATFGAPTVTVEVTGSQPGKFSPFLDFVIQVKTDRNAPFVWLQVPKVKGRFSRNGYLQDTAQETVLFHSAQDVTLEEIKRAVQVQWLKTTPAEYAHEHQIKMV